MRVNTLILDSHISVSKFLNIKIRSAFSTHHNAISVDTPISIDTLFNR